MSPGDAHAARMELRLAVLAGIALARLPEDEARFLDLALDAGEDVVASESAGGIIRIHLAGVTILEVDRLALVDRPPRPEAN